MGFLNQAAAQLKDLFRGMTPAARITTGLLLSVVVISLVVLLRIEDDKADYYLFNGNTMNGRELALIEGALGEAGLNDHDITGNRVAVPRAKRHIYYAALKKANAMPKHASTAFDQLFGQADYLDTRDMRDLKARRAQEESIALMIRAMEDIEEADVMIAEVEQGGVRRRRELRALVSVQPVGNSALNEELIRSIRQQVYSAAGVDLENVVVANRYTGTAYGGKNPEGKPIGEESAYQTAQRWHEERYREKIERMFPIPGLRVAVQVELNPSLSRRTTSQKYDEKPVPVHMSIYEKSSSTSYPQSQGRPGVASNILGNQPQVVSPTESTSTATLTESRENTDRLAGVTHEEVETSGLVPEQVKVAILVPRNHFEEVWREENATLPGEPPQEPDRAAMQAIETRVIQNIQTAVSGALPEPDPGVDKYPLVTVTPYTPILPEVPPGPSVASTASSWFSAHWETFGLLALAITALLLLRGMLRSSDREAGEPSLPRQQLPIHSLLEPEPEVESESEEDQVVNSLKARFHSSGRSLRDELTELVKEDPDAAANVIRNWIGDAA